MTDEPLALREVFDPKERIDRFVFLLFETLADLGTMESRMKGNLWGDGPIAQTLYLQRHLAARVIDSWRAIRAIRIYDDVRQFVTDAGAIYEADWLIENLTKEPDTEEDTPVEKLFRSHRQRTVHLATVDSDALRKTLEAAADVAVQIGVHEDKRIIEFPETAITWAIFGDPSTEAGEKALGDRAAMIETVLNNFLKLGEKCLDLHLERRGLDLGRLLVDRRQASDADHSPSSAS
ncbi:MAG: hypothetical protein AB7V58_06290 [Solirubrobacterales bacterium]